MNVIIREDVSLIFDTLSPQDEPPVIDRPATIAAYIAAMEKELESFGYDSAEIIDTPGTTRTEISFDPEIWNPVDAQNEVIEVERIMMERFAWSDFWVEEGEAN